jgi:hypothetical protein
MADRSRNPFQHLRRWHIVILSILAFFLLVLGGMYGIARWYMSTQAGKPYILGSSFIPAYARSLGLDPEQTMDALIDDVGVRHFRLVSYWDAMEPAPGRYDFTELDWQFAKAEKAHATVTLSLGLRQPRWPECHMPAWAAHEPASQWQPQLEAFMTAVVNRYKSSPALRSYQVENEFFLRGFGTCTNFDRQRLVGEYNLVKKLDPHHTAIVARSNNGIGWPVGDPQPDEFGISIYKRVWSPVIGTYFNYPYPAWYYSFLGGWEKLMTGRDMLAHELQAEAWPPSRTTIPQASLAEQNKSFSPQIFKDRLRFARATGLREIYLWSGEYWYYRKVKMNDPSLWNIARQEFRRSQ